MDLVVVGGIAGITRHLTLTQSGAITVADGPMGYDVVGQASPELLGQMTRLLRTARRAKKSTDPPIPDAASASLSVRTDHWTYEIDSPEIDSLLQAAADRAVMHAVVGAWREASWALCHPAPTADIDLPIDELVFRPDSSFSVTWRGGGARTTGVPHVRVPDYSGRYTFTPATGAIDLHTVGGSFIPRDFAGTGHLSIKRDTLTLHNVWLGTRQALHKPDVCHLIFARQ
jgi:hypothetical protein